MGLTPEAEEAMERSMREDQEKWKRQAEQRKNNEQLAEMIAQKLQKPSHRDDNSDVATLKKRIAELEHLVASLSNNQVDSSEAFDITPSSNRLKFSLMKVDLDYGLFDKSYITPQKPVEFTAPQDLDAYPGGLLEYIIQCGRKNGFSYSRIAFKLKELIPPGSWGTEEELCERILYELVNEHHQPHPDPREPDAFWKINNIISNKQSSCITLPSGKWSYALYYQVSFDERVGEKQKYSWYKAMELRLKE
jgi:hypothetical protein